MVVSGPLEPVVVEPVVNREKLLELLALQAEYPALDYKESCDLTKSCLDRKRNQVELAKDVGAMSVKGGFLAIGVDDLGGPTGKVTPAMAACFDEAALRPMLLTWLPDTLEIRTQVHEIGGHSIILLYIAPNPAGCVFFRALGQYGQGKDAKAVFREGEVYWRDGTQSRPLSQRGLEEVVRRRVDFERTVWERDHAAEYLRLAEQLRSGTVGQRVAQGPSAELSFALESQTLTSAAVELLRASDDIPLRLLFDAAPRRARELLNHDDLDGLTGTVERLSSLAAMFLTLERREWFDRAVALLAKIFKLPMEGVEYEGHPSRGTAAFWLMVTEYVLGLGALAVRKEDWQAVRTLAQPTVPAGYTSRRTWLRHAQVMGTRTELLEEQRGTQRIKLSLLSLARDVVRRTPALHPDTEPDDEQILTGLTRFDFLSCLVGIDVNGGFYPNFAHFRTERTSPAAQQLLQDPAERRTIFHGNDTQLARALHNVDRHAQHEGWPYDGWEGYPQPVQDFIAPHIPSD